MIQDAIILLAGLGTRLKPLTDASHKALLTIGDKTILQRQIEALQSFGIQKFHLALGYRADDIQNYVRNHFPDLNVAYYENPVYAQTNTAYSLWLVIQKMPRGFLLLDGDVLFTKSLLQIFKTHADQNALLCETDPSKLDPEAVKFCTNAQNQITQIGKAIALSDAKGESIGIGQFQADWNRTLNAFLNTQLQNTAHHNWYYEDAFQRIFEGQQAPAPFFVLSTGEQAWVEVDDHADLKRAQELFT